VGVKPVARVALELERRIHKHHVEVDRAAVLELGPPEVPQLATLSALDRRGLIRLNRAMPNSRFPSAKYLRELRAMHTDLCQWRAAYLEAAAATTSLHMAGRFSGRAAVLEDAIEQLRSLTDVLYGLPRLS
jgi:hypothetical protein